MRVSFSSVYFYLSIPRERNKEDFTPRGKDGLRDLHGTRTHSDWIRACVRACVRVRESVCACGVCSPTRTSAYVIVLNKRNRWMLYDVRVGEREKGESKKERERGCKSGREWEKEGDKTLFASAFSKFYYVRRFTFIIFLSFCTFCQFFLSFFNLAILDDNNNYLLHLYNIVSLCRLKQMNFISFPLVNDLLS